MVVTPALASPPCIRSKLKPPRIPVPPGAWWSCGRRDGWRRAQRAPWGFPFEHFRDFQSLKGPLGMIRANPLHPQRGYLRPSEDKGFA